ncbi:MAG: hypothetical protein ACOVVK_11070 [Elsteraceae bacterium]
MTQGKTPPRPLVTPEQFLRQRRGRNLALGGVLLFMVVLFFAISIAQMSR